MSLSTAFNVISSSFAANAAQTAVVSNNIANVNTPGYSREIANVVTNSYGGADVDFDHPRGQRRAPGAGLELDLPGGGAAGDFRRVDDARPNRRRQFIDLLDLGRQPERRLALRHARQPAKRAHNLRRLADLVVRRRRRGVGGLRSRLVAQQRERDGPAGARNRRPEHGLVGRHDQFAAQSVHGRQQRRRHRASDGRQHLQRSRIRATRS